MACFEANHRIKIPGAMREFYNVLHLACLLEGGAIDGEVFLTDLDNLYGDPPPVLRWQSGLHIVFAFHGHSGLVCAATLGIEDPPVYWGSDVGPISDPRPSLTFSEWVFSAVERYEETMDFWQDQYRRHGGEWIRKKVGMGKRLGGTQSSIPLTDSSVDDL